jgi:hypothetical protein
VAGLSFPQLQNGELSEFEITIAARQNVMIMRSPLKTLTSPQPYVP